ncbi:Rrp15p-domain-containing protein [Sordaria brevicollis]|uniref:Rrp15p-domain-containing protein n=1 Tax=Sordaria brevicollis TaxID=83679 RepID=A0AAE0PMM1_SORBR|nr:Rrp15p-domain-containing protein [Sordaria brevicollis]
MGMSKRKQPPTSKGKPVRPSKKQKAQALAAYHSSSEEESDNEQQHEDQSDDEEGGGVPAHLLDSDDEDLDNLVADDGASTDEEQDASDSDSETEQQQSKKSKKPQQTKPKFIAKDAPDSDSDSLNGGGSDLGSDLEDEDDEFDLDNSDAEAGAGARKSTKSKRNDPEAFATSITKMLSSKLPASRRADPIVARSAESAAAAKSLVDAALEAKARKRLREQKRLAFEKGRVRDVLVPSKTRTLNIVTGEIEEIPDGKEGEQTTGQILETERRLRKTAQRGVVKLFNAVRAAQVKAMEAERLARKEGIVGVKRREEKVAEMSRKGFLDLIANGGGGLKKGGLEEA